MVHAQLKHGIIGITSAIFGFILKAFYRPYAYRMELTDLGLANHGPSFFYVIGLSQLLLLRKFKNPLMIVAMVVAASLFFEIYQARSRPFDLGDVIASLLGGLISCLFIIKKASDS